MTIIHATGTSESHYRAERATITARVAISSPNRSTSISTATKLHNRIAARGQQLRDSGDATWHAADAISSSARKSYEPGSKSKVIIEHFTSSRVRIKLANLELVGALVTELAELGVETNVEWSLTEAFRRKCEQYARKAAVGEARKIAEDYAEALGESIERVVSISDTPAGFSGSPARFSATNSGEPEVTVAEITVSASVKGEFETTLHG